MKKNKLFIVRKLVMATDVSNALVKEKKQKPDDVFIDEDWKKENLKNNKKFGF